jgi:transcriptional regulator with XRE-family HTH domain
MLLIAHHGAPMESVKQYVREHQLSHEQFGQMIGVTRGTASKLITGTMKPSLVVLRTIHQQTGIPLATLIDEGIGDDC